jgi:HSP20 family protein
MTLVSRNQNWLPFMFNDLFDKHLTEKNNDNSPAINIKEGKDNFEIEVAAPGLNKSDFAIRIDEDNDLIICAEKKQEGTTESNENEKRFLRRDFTYSKFEQSLSLPENIDKEAIIAKMEHGVLQIVIPKISEEELKKVQRQIEIQ